MNESSSHPAPLMTALTVVGPASTHECTGGCFKASVVKLREANQNIFLNDNKLLKWLASLIHVGT